MMIIDMKLELNEEAQSELFISTLVDDARMIAQNIREIYREGSWADKSYLRQDMEDNQRYLSAMRTLISYYFVYDEAAEYLSELDHIICSEDD